MNEKQAIEELRKIYIEINDCSKYPPFKVAYKALEKEISYSLKSQYEDTGVCKCGVVTEIIDEPFYCKYCGQRLSK